MKKTATNQFGDGLVTDFHPLTAKNTTLVDALNATLVTTKGNEMILQNDAGNIRIKIEKENNEIEYAQLSEGFIPVGIKEYNGIIYIASYNNDTGEGELGSYPSPEYIKNEKKGKLINVYKPLNNLIGVIDDPIQRIEELKLNIIQNLNVLNQKLEQLNLLLSLSDLFDILYSNKKIDFNHGLESCSLIINYINSKLVCSLLNYQWDPNNWLGPVLYSDNDEYTFDDNTKIEITPPCILTKFIYPESDLGSETINISYTEEEQELINLSGEIQLQIEELSLEILNLIEEIQLNQTELNEKELTGIVYDEIKSFTTANLNFDLMHPVNIEVLPSYDGSVNLIINDGKNIPRLINSGFSVTDSGLYQIPDRYNNKDNYYPDTNDLFNIRTSLIKRIKDFPKIKYEGLLNSGDLKVGNYNLYFKYCDDDGNETDFIGESSIISVFKGIDSDPFSIDGGVEDMNANKSIKVKLEDLDSAYHYVKVYYVKQSSAIDSNRIPVAYKISKKFPIKRQGAKYWCDIVITGNEVTELIALSEINAQYYVANASKTQVQCLNILFLGNNTLHNLEHTKLTALSLYIQPYGIKTLASSKIGKVNPENYKESNSNFVSNDNTHVYPMEYYNTKNIYYNVGYWNEEFYRLGIIYIFNDNTKSPVYNILGGELSFDIPEALELEDTCDALKSRNYRGDVEEDYVIGNETLNVLGVIHFKDKNPDNEYLYSIGILLPKNFEKWLKKLDIKAFFFVRLKRIPTIAALGYTLPWDKESKTPILTYYGDRIGTLDDITGITPNLSDKVSMLGKKRRYCIESFLEQIGDELRAWEPEDNKLMRLVSNTYYKRLHYIPDWAIDYPMFSSEDSLKTSTDSNYIVNYLWSILSWDTVEGNLGFCYSKLTLDQTDLVKKFRSLYIEERKSGYDTDKAKKVLFENNYSFDYALQQYNNEGLEGNIYKFTLIITDNFPSIDSLTDTSSPSLIIELNTCDALNETELTENYYLIGLLLYNTESEILDSLEEKISNIIANEEGSISENITWHRGGVDYTTTFSYNRVSNSLDPFINMPSDVTLSYLGNYFGGYYVPSVSFLINNGGVIYLKHQDGYSFSESLQGVSYPPSWYYFLNGHLANEKSKIDHDTKYKSSTIKHYYDLYKYCNGKQMTAICPEFEVRLHYFNTVFTGTEFNIKYLNKLLQPGYLGYSKDRYYYTKYQNILPNNINTNLLKFKIVTVTDNVPVVAIDKTIFKSVIGSEAEAYRFSYINEEHSPLRLTAVYDDSHTVFTANKKYNDDDPEDFNFVRGIYSPYLGIDAVDNKLFSAQEGIYNLCLIFNIYYKNVENSLKENEKIRFLDNSPYYTISDIFEINKYNEQINLFRGDCFLCTFTHRLNRNFNDPTSPTNDHILDSNTWQKNYEPDTGSNDKIEKLNRINRGDINAVKLGSWITIKVRSSYNLSIRSLDESHLQELGIMGRARGFYPLQLASPDGGFKIPNSYVINDGFGSTTGEQYYETLNDIPFLKSEFQNQIAYSDISVNDSFLNGYRIFRGQHYRDYTKQYGAITKLVELLSNLLCVFEHGAALIPINERALAAEGSGGEVYINNSNVLPETPKILSDMFGSQWAESIVKTPYYVYGVDAARKKIWRTNGALFEVISDFRVEKFLVDNLTIDNNDNLPVLGIKNIVTHYNANKSDVMFTFYTRKLNWNVVTDLCGNIISQEPELNNSTVEDELAWNICYNEILLKFETFYSWIPIASANIDNEFYSFDRECSREILLNLEQSDITDPPLREDETGHHKPIIIPYLWKHGKIGIDRPKPTHWYGELHPFEFEFIVNEESGLLKIFDNLRIISNNAEPESFHFTIEGDNYEFSSDKPNMYYRQEATKALFLNLGSHISFKENYVKLFEHLKQNTKSTIFPLYYNRIDIFNDIYDHYTLMLDSTKSRDYKELSGSEINWNEDLQQFFITTHVKNNPIDKNGYLRGNSRYLEGLWQILIPTITLMQKNEENYWNDLNWINKVPPIVINRSILIPDDLTESTIDKNGLPNTYSMGDIQTTGWTFRKETNIRDKYCKIRIRYSGEKLAVISAVITTFTLSYA